MMEKHYIVLLGLNVNSFTNSLIFEVALNGSKKLGLYNYAELEDNQTPHVNTRFTLRQAKRALKNGEEAQRQKSISPEDICSFGRIIPADDPETKESSHKMNTALIQYELDTLKFMRNNELKGLKQCGRLKEFKA